MEGEEDWAVVNTAKRSSMREEMKRKNGGFGILKFVILASENLGKAIDLFQTQ